MKILTTLAALIVCFLNAAYAQNMVPNGDFETYTICPNSYSQLTRATGWMSASEATPDYYNSCDTQTNSFGTPLNFEGNQVPFNGDAYAGIITYEANSDWSEYLLRDINPLTVGMTYVVSIRISLADKSKYATKGIEVYFYVDNIGADTNHHHRIVVSPQVDFGDYGVVTDSINWTTLTDTFVADSAYKHIIIGRFNDVSQIDTTLLNGPYVYAYYYLDDIVVQQIGSNNIKSTPRPQTTLKVVPNPTSSSATIVFDNPTGAGYGLSLCNMQGKNLKRLDNVRSGSVIIEASELVPGIYFYELKDAKGNVAHGKIVIE